MPLLSKESAKIHYKKLYDYHTDNRDYAKKVRDFWHDLEHCILREITNRQFFYGEKNSNNKPCRNGQLDWLKENGTPITLISNIQNFKVHRNDAEHGSKKDAPPHIDLVTYLHLLQTMVKTIHYFSEEPVPENINNILSHQSEKRNLVISNEKEKESLLNKCFIISERIKKPIESNMNITGGTTPVIYFGDFDSAKACTISINPSDREFLDQEGNILSGGEERLCSRKKIGKKNEDTLSNDNVKSILNSCSSYFSNNPYRQWFNRMECMINKFGYSYGYSYDGTNDYLKKERCIHLNLIQWSTTPFWSKIGDDEIKKQHLYNDISILTFLLDSKRFENIIINGSTVANTLDEYLLEEKLQQKPLSFINTNDNRINFTKYTGNYKNMKIIGWSTPLQSPAIGSYANIKLLYEKLLSP